MWYGFVPSAIIGSSDTTPTDNTVHHTYVSWVEHWRTQGVMELGHFYSYVMDRKSEFAGRNRPSGDSAESREISLRLEPNLHHVRTSVDWGNRNRGKGGYSICLMICKPYFDIRLCGVVCRIGARAVCRSSPPRLGCKGDTR